MSSLLLPRRFYSQPQGAVSVDWSNPLTQNLVFATIGGEDLVSKSLPKAIGSSTLVANKSGIAFEALNTTNTGFYFGLQSDAKIYKITNSYTLVSLTDIDALTGYSALICIPYRSGSWSSPYVSLALLRDSVTNNLATSYAVSSMELRSHMSNIGGVVPSKNNFFAVVRRGTTCDFFVNNAVQTGVASSNPVMPGNIDFTNKQPVNLLNHSSSSTGEGTQGCSNGVFIWGRSLSLSDIAVFKANPWQIFKASE